MLPFILTLAQITITGPPPSQGSPPQQGGYIFSAYDYPPEAVRNRWEGSVIVDVLVGKDGSPKSCSIVKSSGHQLLDDTTCGLIMSRAKLVPETDEAGRAIESHFQPPSVTWQLTK